MEGAGAIKFWEICTILLIVINLMSYLLMSTNSKVIYTNATLLFQLW